MKRRPVIVVSGPSGSGKSTLIQRAVDHFGSRLWHSVSATTRSRRPHEVDGVHYHFWSREKFEKAIERGEMLEYATVFGQHYYGTPRDEVEKRIASGVAVILDLDVQGAEQIKHAYPDCFAIFLVTPPGEFERRLRARQTESEEAIQRRLQAARDELSRLHEFDYQLVNDDVDRSSKELCELIEKLSG